MRVKEFYKGDKLNTSEELKKIQVKKYITVKEFTEMYSFGKDWQTNRRSRLHDRLPSIQTIRNGKILYEVARINQWFENNNISIR